MATEQLYTVRFCENLIDEGKANCLLDGSPYIDENQETYISGIHA